MSDSLIEFVKDSCKAGKSHDEIRAVLKDAGWANEQISEVLGRFADLDFPVAIPKPLIFASPRLTAINVFHFAVLYLSIYSVVAITFTFLDRYLPDGMGRTGGTFFSERSIGESIRWYLAEIICCVPLVWFTSRVIRKAMIETNQRIPIIRLKLIYFTMFVGAIVLLANGMSLVYYFLSGELGLRFMIKVTILTALVLGVFAYYRPEVKHIETEA